MKKGIISEMLEKERKKDEERKNRIQDTVSMFSKLSGLDKEEIFESETPNELYLKQENIFRNGYSFSEFNNIFGETRKVNYLTSILDFLEVNFKIRLNYELSEFEKKNYENKIKNIVLPRYYLISKSDSEDIYKVYLRDKCCEYILNVWTQLETDLIYQISNIIEPNSTIKEILKNGIENKVNFWFYTYSHYYKYCPYGNYRNGIIMSYPPEDMREEILKKKTTNDPYAKDLMEDRDQLLEFQRKMNDTSFWNSVLKCFYEKGNENLNKEINLIYKPNIIRQEKEIKELTIKVENAKNVKKDEKPSKKESENQRKNRKTKYDNKEIWDQLLFHTKGKSPTGKTRAFYYKSLKITHQTISQHLMDMKPYLKNYINPIEIDDYDKLEKWMDLFKYFEKNKRIFDATWADYQKNR